jgi:hypothetical protein
MRTPLRRLAAAAVGAAALATVAVVTLPAYAAPPTPDFGPSIEGYAASDSQDTCDPSPKPGALALRDMLNAEYGRHASGIGRNCSVGGTSEHKEGRALDYHFNYHDSGDRADAQDMINWLLRTDRHGNRHANARRLGVMYLIWNREIWTAARADDGWRPYSGASPHTDHIHVSLSWAGARKQTSWWTASPEGPQRRKYAPTLAYDNGDGSMRLFRWASTGSGFTRAADYESGSFALASVGDRVASGDVNGDGRTDVVMAYQNADGTWALHAFDKGGAWSGVWYTGGKLDLDRVGGRLVVGDFNGDGKAEPALVYDNGDDTMKIFRWTSTGSGFARAADYQSGAFALGNVGDRVVAADADGDGKDDIVMAYQKADGTWQLNTFRSGNSSSGVWYTGGQLNLDRAGGRLTAGDYNADGKAEPALVYDNGDGTMKIFRWYSSGSAFTRTEDYQSGSFSLGNVDDRVASGDIDGDGYDDIAMAYQNADGTWAVHAFNEGASWSKVWYTGGQMNLDRVGGRFVLGAW